MMTKPDGRSAPEIECICCKAVNKEEINEINAKLQGMSRTVSSETRTEAGMNVCTGQRCERVDVGDTS